MTAAQKNLALAMRRSPTLEQKVHNMERQKIAQELFKFSREIIEEFDEIFFPTTAHYDAPGTELGGEYGKYNYYVQNVIDKDGDYSNITMLCENSYNDFWDRWNRFKRLKAFL